MSEELRLKDKKLGGYGVEIETDCFTLGQKRKNNVGSLRQNKCYVQFLGERGGDIIMEVFPNPRGGSERLSQISPLLDAHVEDGSFFIADSSRAFKAWHDDHPEKDLWHLVIVHARANEEGFTWYCYLDEKDGVQSEYFDEEEDHRLIEVKYSCCNLIKKHCLWRI